MIQLLLTLGLQSEQTKEATETWAAQLRETEEHLSHCSPCFSHALVAEALKICECLTGDGQAVSQALAEHVKQNKNEAEGKSIEMYLKLLQTAVRYPGKLSQGKQKLIYLFLQRTFSE